MTDTNYTCSMCGGPAEHIDTDGHWLTLYCESCDMEFERAAYGDLEGMSLEDLQNLSGFSEE